MRDIKPSRTKRINIHKKHFDNNYELVKERIITDSIENSIWEIIQKEFKNTTEYEYKVSYSSREELGNYSKYHILVKKHKLPPPPPPPPRKPIDTSSISGGLIYSGTTSHWNIAPSTFVINDSYINAGKINFRDREEISLYEYVFLVEALEDD